MFLKKIQIFPIKSLDAVSLQEVTITKGQTLSFDRRWAIHRKRDGRTVNGKKYPAIHQLRTSYNLEEKELFLKAPHQAKEKFSLVGELLSLNTYLSDYFGEEVEVLENAIKGFPDHSTNNVGASLVSIQTLEQIGAWFDLPVAEVNRRMRMNFIVDAKQRFEEDKMLANNKINPKTYLFGDIEVQTYKPCVRCVVPSRDSKTGTLMKGFQKEFMQQRLELQPHLLEHPLYPHPYMCGLVLLIPKASIGKTIEVGAEIVAMANK